MKEGSNFNSIKVRLKLAPSQKGLLDQQSFQFHKGTIKTKQTQNSFGPEGHFNSIKVRLKLVG